MKVASGELDELDVYTVQEFARKAGITEHAVRKALRERRVRRCNPASERPLFSASEVARYIRGGGKRSKNGVEQKRLHMERTMRNGASLVSRVRSGAVMTMKRVTLLISDEDWENMPLALGVAVGSLSHETDHVMAMRARKRLLSLFDALKLANVEAVDGADGNELEPGGDGDKLPVPETRER